MPKSMHGTRLKGQFVNRRLVFGVSIALTLLLGCSHGQKTVRGDAQIPNAPIHDGEPMPFLKELQGLRDAAYVKAREKALVDHRDSIRLAFPSNDIPDLRAAYKLMVEQPKKAVEYQALLAGNYRSIWPANKAAKEPPQSKITQSLEGYGADYLPLGEEYLFQLPGSALNVSYACLAQVFLKFNPEKGRLVYAKGWRQAQKERPEQAWFFLDGIATLKVVELAAELRTHYQASKNAEERDYYRLALAELGDEENDKHVQIVLQSDHLQPEERDAFFAAYLKKRGGMNALTLAEAYGRFKSQTNQEWIVRKLSLYNETEAKVWQKMAESETDAAKQEKIRTKLAAYAKQKADAERLVK